MTARSSSGAIITRYAPDMVEIFGALGYDFVMIDCEHGPASLDQVEHMVRAAESFGITPIARIPDHSDQTILRFLDRGLQGIIVPHVNTGEQAAAIARAARYYPDGYRGMGGGRAQDYGIGVARDEATAVGERERAGDPHGRGHRSRGQPGRHPGGFRRGCVARGGVGPGPEHGATLASPKCAG